MHHHAALELVVAAVLVVDKRAALPGRERSHLKSQSDGGTNTGKRAMAYLHRHEQGRVPVWHPPKRSNDKDGAGSGPLVLQLRWQ